MLQSAREGIVDACSQFIQDAGRCLQRAAEYSCIAATLAECHPVFEGTDGKQWHLNQASAGNSLSVPHLHPRSQARTSAQHMTADSSLQLHIPALLLVSAHRLLCCVSSSPSRAYRQLDTLRKLPAYLLEKLEYAMPGTHCTSSTVVLGWIVSCSCGLFLLTYTPLG